MHTMTMINEHEGTEEWLCSVCGRHLLVNWNPKFRRTVLIEGDSSAQHSGSKGTMLTMDKMDVSVDENLPPENQKEQTDDARMIPWLAWMDEIGFENLWSGGAK